MSRAAALLDLLDGFEPDDALEARHRDELRALTQVSGDPFARNHWEPGHFTASAFVLSPDDQDILLIFHEKLQRWLQPGGHIDPEDTDVVSAALREVAEETGLTGVQVVGAGLFDVDVHVIPPRKQDPPHRHYDARILLRAPDRSFSAGSDALAARWVPLADVESVDTDESVLRAVRKIRRR